LYSVLTSIFKETVISEGKKTYKRGIYRTRDIYIYSILKKYEVGEYEGIL